MQFFFEFVQKAEWEERWKLLGKAVNTCSSTSLEVDIFVLKKNVFFSGFSLYKGCIQALALARLANGNLKLIFTKFPVTYFKNWAFELTGFVILICVFRKTANICGRKEERNVYVTELKGKRCFPEILPSTNSCTYRESNETFLVKITHAFKRCFNVKLYWKIFMFSGLCLCKRSARSNLRVLLFNVTPFKNQWVFKTNRFCCSLCFQEYV